MASHPRGRAGHPGQNKAQRGHSHSKNSGQVSEGDVAGASPDTGAASPDAAALLASGARIYSGSHDLADFAGPAQLAGMAGGLSGGAGALAISPGLAAKVLVLNKLYMAVRVISARRAFCMLSQRLAEVIHVEDGQYLSYDFESWTEISELRKEYEAEQFDWVKTVRFDIAVPKVIRLLGYDRLPEQAVKLNRRNLFARDRNQCQYCGRSFPTSELSIDHVKPRAQGGGDTWDNLVCACIRCNAKKGGRTPEQAHMALTRKPVRPKRNPMITVRLGQQRYESWKTFLDNAYWSVELR